MDRITSLAEEAAKKAPDYCKERNKETLKKMKTAAIILNSITDLDLQIFKEEARGNVEAMLFLHECYEIAYRAFQLKGTK